ncbi:hypothetical protein [Halomonas sp. SpR8]|uniref:hypothetical protein n=1 Tax=Halomonas sp. SpR8 TaxID=3050463 RepID=UPI0027E4EA8E|nr:hypothetical protein [Halomonas sp. SpR8]MDQ7728538.1 hypothetical protein [Halomonas sp. SpR8]
MLAWAGAAWISGSALVVVSALGCSYIVYLAVKIARANADLGEPDHAPRLLSFRDGLVM